MTMEKSPDCYACYSGLGEIERPDVPWVPLKDNDPESWVVKVEHRTHDALIGIRGTVDHMKEHLGTWGVIPNDFQE